MKKDSHNGQLKAEHFATVSGQNLIGFGFSCGRLSIFTPQMDPLKGPLGVDHQRTNTDIAADLA